MSRPQIRENDIPTIIADAYQTSRLFLQLDDPIKDFALSVPGSDYDVSSWPAELREAVIQAAEHYWRPGDDERPSQWMPERREEALLLFKQHPPLDMIFQHQPEVVAKAWTEITAGEPTGQAEPTGPPCNQ